MGNKHNSIIDSLAFSVQRPTQTIGGFDGELHYRPPAPDEWCIVEIVGLLGDIESRYRGRFERIVSEDIHKFRLSGLVQCPILYRNYPVL